MENINLSYLRPLKAKKLQNTYESSLIEKQSLNADVYSNATILPLKKHHTEHLLFGYAGVLDSDGYYVSESAIEGVVESGYQSQCEKTIDKKVVYCGYLVNHWGHFLVEAVARLWYFLENDETIDNYVFVIDCEEEREIKGNYKEFFELPGVWDKLEIINQPQKYREVVVPELGYERTKHFSEQFKNIFKTVGDNIVADGTWNRYDRVFFTRSHLKKANQFEIGNDFVDSFFENNDYKILAPEEITLSQMIFYLRNSNVCAMVSGTLHHNVLFGNDGQDIIIIEKQPFTIDHTVGINIAKHLGVIYIDANLSIYPVDFGAGPFILAPTKCFKRFVDDYSYRMPNESYLSERYLKKAFKKYIKKYVGYYGYQWVVKEAYYSNIDYIYEAYMESWNVYNKFLTLKKPFKFSHLFCSVYYKGFIKRLIGFLVKR